MKIFSGSANPKLAEEISEYLKIPLGELQTRRFPDGEVCVKIVENIRGKDVFIIQPTCHPVNENLMELLILIDAMRRASAKRITAVIPYYGYGRQDRKDQPRVPITAKLVANLLVAAGTNRILAMDLHAQQIQGFFDIPVDHLFAAPVLVRHLREKKIPKAVVVSPDPGGMKMAYAYSRMLKSELAIVAAKARRLRGGIIQHRGDEATAGHTGGRPDFNRNNPRAAAQLLRQHGATNIITAASHVVFAPGS